MKTFKSAKWIWIPNGDFARSEREYFSGLNNLKRVEITAN